MIKKFFIEFLYFIFGSIITSTLFVIMHNYFANYNNMPFFIILIFRIIDIFIIGFPAFVIAFLCYILRKQKDFIDSSWFLVGCLWAAVLITIKNMPNFSERSLYLYGKLMVYFLPMVFSYLIVFLLNLIRIKILEKN
ncbi:MAG: hypothetical protein ABII88_07620 [Candidatus Omnitrophota bacterium]